MESIIIDEMLEWYNGDASMSIDVLKSHIRTNERQILASIEDFKNNKEEVTLMRISRR
jgi:hypothetical protein